MEDLSKKLLSLEEIKKVLKRNFDYSTELLKDRLSNARILYTSSTETSFLY